MPQEPANPSRDNVGPGLSPEALLVIVRAAVAELHAGKALTPEDVTLDSRLDRDLGFDSLGRMELLTRIERAHAVSIPEQAFAAAETVRDLLRTIHAGQRLLDRSGAAVPDVVSGKSVGRLPASAETLLQVMDWHLQQHPERTHVLLYRAGDNPEPISYAALWDGARAIAAGLAEHGVTAGDRVAIMLPTGRDYLYSFLGILVAGGVPVPIYPPARPSQIEDHLRRHARILGNAGTAVLITIPEGRPAARLLQSLVAPLRHLLTAGELAAQGSAAGQPRVSAGDLAFLQYTSGSTGNPKGVELTHANLIANIRAMGSAIGVSSEDLFVSWLPLYHDMGLIGAWLGSMYHAMPLVLMSPLDFLARPQRWLWAIHRHRASLSAAPNFAYELCLRKVQDTDVEGLDLGSWRIAFNGAEPVSPRTIEGFAARFGRYGFRREAMSPVYGLAESSVGLAFPPPGRGPLIDRVQRETLTRSGRAVPADPQDPRALELVACGRPLPGHQVRVVDPLGKELPERREGRLQFQGPSSTRGYFRNPAETRRLFNGDWLNTGDLAYLAGGEIYLTSRVKDVVIRAGRNIYPYELENAVGEAPGIRKGCVAVFGATDTRSGTERLVVLAETRETDSATLARLQQRILDLSTDLLGARPDTVLLVPPHSILKTSSGKIRRAATRDLFERGLVAAGQRALWRQLARLWLSGLPNRLRRTGHLLADGVYAAYAWGIFCLLAPIAWILVALLPGAARRRNLVRRMARLLATLTATPIVAEGLEHWDPEQPAVLVANHASYLDGLLLTALLPGRFHFVAKGELRGSFLPRLFLQRIGSEFVERFDRAQSTEDARRLAAQVHAGHSLLFFPEGTFQRAPGLLPFRMGAFLAAAQAGVPLLPVAIRGTRAMLRSGSWFPRRGILRVTVCAPLQPDGEDWAAAVRLRDRARTAILHHSDEPDRDFQPQA